MGIVQLSEFRDDLILTVGDRGHSPAQLNLWINDGYREVVSVVDLEDTDEILATPTVAAQRVYTGPVGPMMIKTVRNVTADAALGWLAKNEFLRRAAGDTGSPTKWTRHKEEIHVWPTPVGVETLDVYYKEVPAALVADGDATIIPAIWDRVIIILAASYAYLSVNEDSKALTRRNYAASMIASKITEADFNAETFGLRKTVSNVTEDKTDGLLNP